MIHALEVPLRSLGGARASRITDGGHARIPEHAHPWPVLSIYVSGSYTNRTGRGEARVASPSAMFYAAGEAHANLMGGHGLEQIEIEFDPAWLGHSAIRENPPVQLWTGGAVAPAARALGRLWSRPDTPETELIHATRRFLELAAHAPEVPRPPWLPVVLQRLRTDTSIPAQDLAGDLGMNPAWLAQAYRKAMGEGLRQTAARLRVETASALLRSSDAPAAQIALDAGFCDQSHMIRTFRNVLGRTPAKVRSEWPS